MPNLNLLSNLDLIDETGSFSGDFASVMEAEKDNPTLVFLEVGHVKIYSDPVVSLTGNAILVPYYMKALSINGMSQLSSGFWIRLKGEDSFTLFKECGFSEDTPVMQMDDTFFYLAKNRFDPWITQKNGDLFNKMKAADYLLRILNLIKKRNEYIKDRAPMPIATNNDQLNQTSKYLTQILDYIHEHYNEKISFKELAKTIGISNFYLSHMFKRHLNISAYDYLKRLRLENSRKMLIETTKNINRIASDTGYENSTNFSKAFRKEYGISPLQYRKMKKSERK